MLIDVTKEYIVIVADGCSACDEVKQKLKGNKKFKILDLAKSKKAQKIASELDIMSVPTLLEIDRKKGTTCILDGAQTKCVKMRN